MGRPYPIYVTDLSGNSASHSMTQRTLLCRSNLWLYGNYMSVISSNSLKILNFSPIHFSPALQFCNEEIGRNYYTNKDMQRIYEQSTKDNLNASYVVVNDRLQIKGIRFSFAPGNWPSNMKALSSDKWNLPIEKVAYFKSLFLSKNIQGNGLGKSLSLQSMNTLTEMGAKAIVCHSWKESPNNSSKKYLEKFGFKVIKEHPQFWSALDYVCPRCGKPPCKCTATEMILYL